MKYARAFTLIEVMIALFVLAITFVGVIGTASHVSRGVISLKEKTVGAWVVQNIAAEMSLGVWGEINDRALRQGDVQMAGERWYWKAQATPEEGIQRITISVSKRLADQPVSTLEFLHVEQKKPEAKPEPPAEEVKDDA